MTIDYKNINPAAILVTGGFDPLHSGHISYLKEAHKLNNNVIVGLNSDEWLARKKGKSFMPYHERESILKELKCVNKVISFDDNNDTACDAIARCLEDYYVIIFANGGDRHNENTAEYNLYRNNNRVIFRWGIGGTGKTNSSSWILKNYLESQRVLRDWGYYRVLCEGDGYKVKELVIKPHSALSKQRHKHRSETWNIIQGEASVILHDSYEEQLTKDSTVIIPPNTIHKGINNSDKDAHIVEIWRGESKLLNESDIERL